VNAATCGVYANGSSTSAVTGAIDESGGANITTSGIWAVGGVDTSGGATITYTDGGTKHTGVSPTADPYGGISLASIESSTGTTVQCSGTGSPISPSNGATLNPGVFCGGISVSGGAAITLNSGVYYIAGGGFSASGGATITATSGVTIVLVDYNGSPATFNMSGGAKISINAMSSGPTAGIAVYGDPANTGAVNFSGGSTSTINGALYFPSSDVSISGGASSGSGAVCTELIAYDINFSGGMTFGTTNCGKGVKTVGGSTTVSVVMVE
jgi:hypothetical protein